MNEVFLKTIIETGVVSSVAFYLLYLVGLQLEFSRRQSEKALEAEINHGHRELELIEARHKAATEWEAELLQILRAQATATKLLSTALESKFKS